MSEKTEQEKNQIKNYLRENLRLNARSVSEYQDCITGYQTRYAIELFLDGEVISEVTL